MRVTFVAIAFIAMLALSSAQEDVYRTGEFLRGVMSNNFPTITDTQLQCLDDNIMSTIFHMTLFGTQFLEFDHLTVPAAQRVLRIFGAIFAQTPGALEECMGNLGTVEDLSEITLLFSEAENVEVNFGEFYWNGVNIHTHLMEAYWFDQQGERFKSGQAFGKIFESAVPSVLRGKGVKSFLGK